MKKKILIVCGSLMMAMAAGICLFEVQATQQASLLSQNVEALAQAEIGATKKLMGNASGSRYCCCPGSQRCGAAGCPPEWC